MASTTTSTPARGQPLQWMPTQVLGVPVAPDKAALAFPGGATDYPKDCTDPEVVALRSSLIETRQSVEQMIRTEGTDYKAQGIKLHDDTGESSLNDLRQGLNEYTGKVEKYEAPVTLRTRLQQKGCEDFLEMDVTWRRGPDKHQQDVMDELKARDAENKFAWHANETEVKLGAQAVLQTQTQTLALLKEERAKKDVAELRNRMKAEAGDDMKTADAYHAKAMECLRKRAPYYENALKKMQRVGEIEQAQQRLLAHHKPVHDHLERREQERIYHMLWHGQETPGQNRGDHLAKAMKLDIGKKTMSNPADVKTDNVIQALVDAVARNKSGKAIEAAASATADPKAFAVELSFEAKKRLVAALQESLDAEPEEGEVQEEETPEQLQARRPGAPGPHHSSGPDPEVIEVVEATVVEADPESEEEEGQLATTLPQPVPMAPHLLPASTTEYTVALGRGTHGNVGMLNAISLGPRCEGG